MSVFDRLTSLIPQVSSASRQAKERSPTRLAPPPSLSPAIVRKEPIQIPLFAEKGLELDTHQLNSGRLDEDRLLITTTC